MAAGFSKAGVKVALLDINMEEVEKVTIKVRSEGGRRKPSARLAIWGLILGRVGNL